MPYFLNITELQKPRNSARFCLFCHYLSYILCLALIIFSQFLHAGDSFKNLKNQQINEILFNIDSYYVEDLALHKHFPKTANSKQIENLFKQLDPYSKYLDEDELEAIFSSTNGRYTGLGIEVKTIDGRIIIANTLHNSPAQLAGLKANDEVTAVNSHSVVGKSINHVAKLIRNSPSKVVQLSISRATNETLEFGIKREQINLESVTSYLDESGIALVTINVFNNHTLHDLAKQIVKMQMHNDHPLSGLVIDLRDNPGGTLQSAVEISDLFLDSGTIVTTKGRFVDANHHYSAKYGDIIGGAPIVVLLNHNSASAAEILAAALRDNQRATLIGAQSYGKGSVQSLIPLGNGNTALKLTTAKYYTPAGESIEGRGIRPDMLINQSMLSEINQDVIIKNIQQLDLFSSLFDQQYKEHLKTEHLITMQ
ncbi:S41 family peptidase [Pseudoalteromonas mariniglutinosa]|uniref:S41 family peptidase n=1 Tax=Pseudoalteromonas mariniglutinosa TaxID=206042 RepID=UPI00384F12D9